MNGANKDETGDDQDAEKGVLFIAVSQFGLGFCFNCIMSFMPFYLLKVSSYDVKETILWTGLIMGGNSMVAAVAAPFWGSLTARIRPKILFQYGMFSTGLIFLVMGFTTSLPLILALRLTQGALGGVSTIGLVLIAGTAPRSKLPRYIGLFQNSLTAGQLIGPPVGAYAAAFFGYRAPFIIALIVLSSALFFCHRYVRDIPAQPKPSGAGGSPTADLLGGWGLIIVGTIHLMFLPSILPQILSGFRLAETSAVKMAGTIMMIYTTAALVGNALLVRLSSRMGVRPVIAGAALAACAFQCLLYLSTGVGTFSLIRALQAGVIAGVIPLVIASLAGAGSGATLGFLNSGRFVGNAAGPMMATSLLAHFNLLTLYLTIAGLTLAMLSVFMVSEWKRKPASGRHR
jgi:DHA1 family multidrug resistance protein-like MFS transporter